MEELFYWIIEYGRVILGFGFLMFIWPLVVFRKYLKGKSATFRFCFCVTGQVVLVNTVVLLLGLLRILNAWTMCIVFYGTFLFSLRDHYALTQERRKKLRYLINGTYGWKNFFFLERRKLVRGVEKFFKRIGCFYKRHWLEYTLLIVTVVYGMIYFTWGAFQERSYGFSDMYVHHSWIYQLSQGNPFSAGIYPEGMHCVIYALNALFGIRIYSCMLFAGAINVAVIIVSIYCLLKELFRWKYCVLFVIIAMLTFGDVGGYIVSSMARMQCTLPQEFAFPAAFICCLYLIKYLKGGRRAIRKGKETKGFWDENLLIFMLALASTIAIHFYATIMAFFLCIGVVAFFWKRIFTKERFLPLVTAVLLGLVVAIAPMVAGFATGIPLQGSLYWAMGVVQQSVQTEEPREPEEQGQSHDNTVIQAGNVVENGNSGDIAAEDSEVVMTEPEESFFARVGEKLHSFITAVINKCQEAGNTIYSMAYLEMYEPGFVLFILITMAVVLVGGSLGTAIIFCVEKRRKVTRVRPSYGGYFIIIYAALVYVIVYAAIFLGLPVIMERYRIGFFCNILHIAIAAIPVDILFSLGKRALQEKGLSIFSVGFAAGMVALIWLTGKYHGYLYFELTRYDATVQVTNQIIEELPEKSYTIVSPTEELYQMIEFGWHEELLDFVKGVEQETYSLPSEYVFVFVEKKPFRYAQLHFHDGPRWLGYDKYQVLYSYATTWPEYVSSEVSDEHAARSLYLFSDTSSFYHVLEPRTVLQSKLYHWCEAFKEKYPNEFKTYYEDEYLVCYYWEQNPYKVYNLVIE